MNKEVDIFIIGGGISGCTSAMFLCSQYSVLVLNKPERSSQFWAESLISPSRRIFRELGISDQINNLEKECCIPSIGIKSYWGNETPAYSDAFRNPDGEGWIINKPTFVNKLQQITQMFPIWFQEGTLNTIKNESSHWKINFSDQNGNEQQVAAKFIIDASGRANILRKKLHLHRIRKDELICISASVERFKEEGLSTIISDENGWWYSCPLPGKKHARLVSYYTDADLIDKRAVQDPGFIKQLLLSKEATLNELEIKEFNEYQYLGIKAANTSKLDNIGERNWIAIGDAAMSFDPLSSQGIYKAMVTAAQASKLIITTDFINIPDIERINTFYNAFYKDMNNIWQHYKEHYQYFYRMEQRWKGSAFWNRRYKRI